MVLKDRFGRPYVGRDGVEGIFAQIEEEIQTYNDYIEESEQEEASTDQQRRRGRSRMRTPHQARPLSHVDCTATRTGRKKSCRLSRRLENARELLHLREEGEELEVNDICPDSTGLFGNLFSEEKSMQTWERFMKKSEEEQLKVLGHQIETSLPHTEAPAQPTVAQRLQQIDRNMRTTLRRHKKHITPFLAELEKDLSTSFTDCPDAVIVLKVDSSFHRLLIHALSQFLTLHSSSENVSGERLTQIESNSGSFHLPAAPLAECLSRL